MSWFFLWLPALALGTLGVGGWRAFTGSAARTTARRRLFDKLEAEGVSFVGSLDQPELGLAMRRRDGATVEFPAVFAVGASGPFATPSLLRCAVVKCGVAPSVPDLVVAEHTVAPTIFGSSPPTAVATGDRAFDRLFGVFPASEGPSSRRAGHSSGEGATSATRWATSERLATLGVLGFRALYVRGGQATFAFGPLPVAGLLTALHAADAVTASMDGDQRVAVRDATVPHSQVLEPAGHPPQPWGLGAAFVAAAFFVSVLYAALVFQDANVASPVAFGGNEVACPDGGIYSTGSGFRNPRRPHLCYRPGRAPSPARDELLFAWEWGSLAVFSAGLLLLFRGETDHHEARAAKRTLDALQR